MRLGTVILSKLDLRSHCSFFDFHFMYHCYHYNYQFTALSSMNVCKLRTDRRPIGKPVFFLGGGVPPLGTYPHNP